VADETALLADLAAQPREQTGEDAAPHCFGQRGMNLSAKDCLSPVFRGVFLFDELRRSINEIERVK